MTKDLASLIGPNQKWLSTTGFLDKVDENLKKAMAYRLVPRAAQHEVVRCRPGTVTNSEFGKAPDQRRTTSLSLVLRRIRGTLLNLLGHDIAPERNHLAADAFLHHVLDARGDARVALHQRVQVLRRKHQ